MRSRAILARGERATSRTRSRLAGVLAVMVVAAMTVQGAGGAMQEAAAATNGVYYLSPTGNDAEDGTSPSRAWRTLDRANRHAFGPGQQLLLQAGASFTGMLYLDAADGGDAAAPVVVGSFGTGRAVIRAAGNPGVYVYNTGGITVQDLDIVGDAATYEAKGGISAYNDLGAGRHRDGLTIARVDVSGFRNGIEVGAPAGSSGFRKVRVSDAYLHDNMEAGLLTYGGAFNPAAPTYANSDVRVERVEARRNVGDPTNLVRNTGNGIVLGSVSGGVIEHSTAHENGSACAAVEGPAGIWTYDSHDVLIQHNVSYNNRTGGGADGDGFDLDQNVSASTLQYNLSYGNDGAGYLIWTAQNSGAHRDNTVRFNISSDDARKVTWYGGITVSGRMSSTQIYNNTVVVTGGSTARPALRLDRGPVGMTIRNNLFVNEVGPVVASPALTPAEVAMQGNNYASVTGQLRLQWGSQHSTLEAWRAASGAEVLDGAATGSSLAPGLQDPRTPTQVLSPASKADGFTLRADSPLLGRGLDLARRFGVSPGPIDHFGLRAAAGATRFDVGAHQPSASVTAVEPTPAAPAPTTEPTTSPTTSPPATAAPTVDPAQAVLGPATTLEVGRYQQHAVTGDSGESSLVVPTVGGTLRLAVSADAGAALSLSVLTGGGALRSASGAGSVTLELVVPPGVHRITVRAPAGTAFRLSADLPAS